MMMRSSAVVLRSALGTARARRALSSAALPSPLFQQSPPDLSAPFLTALRHALADPSQQLSLSREVRDRHGKDEGIFNPLAPLAVCWPRTNEEVSQVVRACAQHRVPIIPYGAGTSVEGHVAALHGGVCVSLAQMNQVLEVNVEDQDCRVQAGCTRLSLGAELKHTGLMFPVDPGADATLGGMASTRASGTNAVRYGTMREAVLGVTAVLADGSIVRTGRRVRKSSAGYDLTHLLVGAEGTLGIITEVALRLHAVPEATSVAVCSFQSLRGAVECVQVVMGSSIPIARCELLDAVAIRAVNAYSHTALAEAPTLFFEFHGTKQAITEQATQVGSIAAECGGGRFQWEVDQERRDALWKARHSAYWASIAQRPGCRGFPTDVCVPISRLADSILAAQEDLEAGGVLAPIVGHVGDGNFHAIMVVDHNNPEEVAKAKRIATNMVKRAIAAGGTCTGEHGIGYGKLSHLQEEHGLGPLHMMHALKQALDPLNIMNPGKLGSPPESFGAGV